MTSADKESDIDVGEEAIQRLAGQVFDAPKDRTNAENTVNGNKDKNGDSSAKSSSSIQILMNDSSR